MPPKKATTTKAAAATKSAAASKTKAALKSAIEEPAKTTRAPSKRTVSAVSTVSKTTAKRKASEIEEEEEESAPVPVKKAKAEPKAKVVVKKAPAKATKAAAPKDATAEKKGSDSESEDEPAPKKTKTAKASPKKAAPKAAHKKVTKAAPKSKAVAKKSPVEDVDESDDEDAEEVEKSAPKAKAAPKAPAPKKVAAPKPVHPSKALPVLNTPPTQILDVFVFGEGGAGELGLGADKDPQGRKPLDVKRPRINHLLSAKDVGVVQVAVGGMHCIALTKDNKILTWGVNDQGTLGRETKQEGKMKDLPVNGEDEDSDSDDDESGLNPSEAEPRQVDPSHFPEGTVFTSVYAGDSTSFALTNTGLVYGWGTFRGNDGIIGFRNGIKTQDTPLLIPELKEITHMAVGTNHVLALNKKGKVFTWGAGEQSQLARRVVSRTAVGALVPREFGLQRKKIVHIGCGDYHSFVVDDKGAVYSWGLNTFGQTGVPKKEETNDNAIGTPTLVKSLEEYDVKQIAGGAHHTLACTATGQVLIWGRIDSSEGGMEIEDMPKDHLFIDENGKPRYLVKPAVVPDIDGVYVATGNDTCIAVDKDGKAYSWGFSGNYQTGQGTSEDVVEATEIANSAVKDKKIIFAGVGGQFGVLGGAHEDKPLTNGV